jgi:phasin family protein
MIGQSWSCHPIQRKRSGDEHGEERFRDTEGKHGQAIAIEFANYSKRSLEDHTAATEKLMSAKSLEKAVEVQTEYVKTAYEGFVAHATKIGELYADLAKELYKPIEGVIGSKPFAS